MEWAELNAETYEYVTVSTVKQIYKRAALAAISDICCDNSKIKPVVDDFLKRINEETTGIVNEGTDNEYYDLDKEELAWQQSFRSIMEDFTKLHTMIDDNEIILDMAQAGLDAVHDLLLWRLDHRTVLPSKDAFIVTTSYKKLGTKTKLGTKAPDIDFQFGLADPKSPTNGECLYGLDACAQIDAWYNYGVLETSASVLAKTTITSHHIPSSISKKKFVLLGGTAELGPAKALLQIPGVTVLMIARGGKRLDEMIEFVTYNAPDDTTLLYPQSDDLYPNGGADILLQGPQISQWILDNTDAKTDELVLVPLASDKEGERHVRLVAAMDLIIERIMRQRHSSSTSLWIYNSPLTCMVIPPTATSTAQQRIQQRPTYEKWANTVTMGQWYNPALLPDATNHDYTILNGIVSTMGPNYVLAKHIQTWRAMIYKYREHYHVSAPFAPLTRTKSNTDDDRINNALEGMHHFEPMLAFDIGPASTLMAAIFIAHLHLLNRQVPDFDESPFVMFWDGAAHSGVWTAPYTLESISVVNYALGKSTCYPKGYIPEGAIPNMQDDDSESQTKTIDPDVLLTLTDSQAGQPMPDSVRERLDFM